MSRQKPEQKVQNKIIKYLKELQANGAPLMYDKRQAGGFTYRAGIPDLWFSWNGRHCEVEIKSLSGERSSAQLAWERICHNANIPYACVNSLEDFIAFFEEIKKEA